ncbi:hypothetical protein HMPREF1207_03818 [Paenibacillus sp. HGH0039]|nr:hypothetical protein HMPREF1207_03818 [Paenibacillus sp. HGH0039]
MKNKFAIALFTNPIRPVNENDLRGSFKAKMA